MIEGGSYFEAKLKLNGMSILNERKEVLEVSLFVLICLHDKYICKIRRNAIQSGVEHFCRGNDT